MAKLSSAVLGLWGMVLGTHSYDLPEYSSLLQCPQQWGPAVLAAAELAAAAMDNWTAHTASAAAVAAAAAAVEQRLSAGAGQHGSSSSSKGKPEANNRSNRDTVQTGMAAAEVGVGKHALRDITGPVVIAVDSIALTLGQALDQDESGVCSCLRVVNGLSPNALRGMWRVLFVYLGWAVQAKHEKLHSRPAAGDSRASCSSNSSSSGSSSSSSSSSSISLASSSTNTSTAQQGGQQTQPAGCYHEQLRASVGAPAAAEGHITPIPSYLVLKVLSVLAQHTQTASSTAGSSSRSSSSCSDSTAEHATEGWEQQQSLVQLGCALLCPEAPLLLLQLLQNSFKSQPMAAATLAPAAAAVEFNMPPTQYTAIWPWKSSVPLLHGMLMGLSEAKGDAAAGEAASSLLGPVLQLPNALLHSAAAAGCQGLKQPAEAGRLSAALLLPQAAVYRRSACCR
jgi:hypothetical protein